MWQSVFAFQITLSSFQCSDQNADQNEQNGKGHIPSVFFIVTKVTEELANFWIHSYIHFSDSHIHFSDYNEY